MAVLFQDGWYWRERLINSDDIVFNGMGPLLSRLLRVRNINELYSGMHLVVVNTVNPYTGKRYGDQRITLTRRVLDHGDWCWESIPAPYGDSTGLGEFEYSICEGRLFRFDDGKVHDLAHSNTNQEVTVN